MKKVIALAVAIVAVLGFAFYYQLSDIGFLDATVYALSDGAIANNLQLKNEKDLAAIDPVQLGEMETLYTRAGQIYVGEEKQKVNKAYPLFVKDSSSLYLISNDSQLVTNQFEKLDSYYGLYVNDGESFNRDGSKADAEEIILLSLANSAYVNSKEFKISTLRGEKTIPLNSVVHFTEQSITYYSLVDGQFVGNMISDVALKDRVTMGDNRYNYGDFLRKLGIIPDEEVLAEKKEEILKEETSLVPPAVKNPATEQLSAPPIEIPLTVDSDGEDEWIDGEIDEEIDLTEEYIAPQVTMTAFRGDFNKGSAKTKLGFYDPGKRLVGDINIFVRRTSGGDDFKWSFSDISAGQKNPFRIEKVFQVLDVDVQYTAYGEYTFRNEAGELETMHFGTQVFTLTEKIVGNKVNVPPGKQSPPLYFDPVITAADFTSTVYYLDGEITTLKDKAYRLVGAIQFNVYKDGALYMRQVVTKKGEFRIGELPPDSEYRIEGLYKFVSKSNKIVEETFFEQTIETRPVSDLDPIEIEYANGLLDSKNLSIKDMRFNTNEGAETILHVGKINMVINSGKSIYQIPGLKVQEMKSRDTINFMTELQLASNSNYDYHFIIYDRFGNELPRTKEFMGTGRTCKLAPTADLKVNGTDFSNVVISAAITNIDSAYLDNVFIEILDGNGIPMDTIISENGGISSKEIQHQISITGGTVRFLNLPPSLNLKAQIVGSYDLADDKGIQERKILSTIPFATARLDTAGTLLMEIETDKAELTDRSAKLDVRIKIAATKKENGWEALVELLDRMIIGVYAPDGTLVYQEEMDRTNGLEDMIQLAPNIPGEAENSYGGKWTINIPNLESKTTYTVKIGADVIIGMEKYPVPKISTSIDNKNEFSFMTMLCQPEVLVNGGYIETADFIELYDLYIDDPDKTINSDVMLRVVNADTNAVVALKRYLPNTNYPLEKFDNLSTNITYKFIFVALEYNNGYGTDTAKINYEIASLFFGTDNGLSGQISMQGLTKDPMNSKKYDAELKVSLIDDNRQLAGNSEYTVRIYKNGTLVDNIIRPITPVGSTSYGEVVTISTDEYAEYDVEIWVTVFGNSLKLAENRFDTDGPIIGLRTEDDIRSYLNHSETYPERRFGRYVFLNDIRITNLNINNEGRFAFMGTLDLQGYTATISSRRGLVTYLGATGIIKNGVVETGIYDVGPSIYNGLVVYVNYGTIQNMQVNVNASTPYLHQDIGGITRYNGSSGVIENFVVHLKVPLYGSRLIGAVAAQNSGIIRNGYVYGEKIIVPNISANIATEYLGGITGLNDTDGIIENVYSTVTVETGLYNSPQKGRIGTIAGQSNGVIRNAYGVGDPTFSGAKDLTLGPAIGSYTTKLQSSAFYISPSIYSLKQGLIDSPNKKITNESLYDVTWQGHVLGKQFLVEGTVDMGYYPHISMPDNMPRQEFVPLPNEGTDTSMDLSNAIVIDQYEKYANVLLTFRNPAAHTIDGGAMFQLGSIEIIPNTQTNIGGTTRVMAKVVLPEEQSEGGNSIAYRSEYSVKSITSIAIGGGTTTITYAQNERTMNVEFFKPISSKEEWVEITDYTQNYRLKADILLSGLTREEVGFFANNQPFSGKIDGGIYNDNYELIGMHAVRGLDMSSGTASGNVIPTLTGDITNLTVDGYQARNPKATNNGFVGLVNSGSLIDNVHIKNAQVSGGINMGVLAGRALYGEIQNCSVSNSKLNNEGKNSIIGGLVGVSEGSFIRNVYAQKIDIVSLQGVGAKGIGGLIGSFNSGELRNGYAVGSIRTTDQNVGGILGAMISSGRLENFWSNMDIYTTVDRAGGIIGSVDLSLIVVPKPHSVSFGGISSAISDVSKIGRTIGNNEAWADSSYAWEGQLINGKVPRDSNGDIMNYGAMILSTEDLKEMKTYERMIGMGANFSYNRIDRGILPKLYSTHGGLIPYQVDNGLPSNFFEITSMEGRRAGTDFMVQVVIKHNLSVTSIEGLNVDHVVLETVSSIRDVDGTSTTLELKVVGTPERYLDYYSVASVTFNSDNDYPLNGQIDFGGPLYREISNYSEWQTIMEDHGKTYENFWIRGDIDFGHSPDAYTDLNINRMVGYPESAAITLKNLDLNLQGDQSGLINKVNAELKNLHFEDITLTNNDTAKSQLGIIGIATGVVKDIGLKNIAITGKALKTSGQGRVGFVGWYSGDMSGITAENLNYTINTSALGGIVGYAENSTMNNISIKDSVIDSSSGNYTGGIIGWANKTSFNDLHSSDSTIKGGSSTGGIGGAMSQLTDFDTNGANLTNTNGQVTGTNNVGGLLGVGRVNSRVYAEPAIVDNCTIIGDLQVGGAFGNGAGYYQFNTIVKNSRIFGTRHVGGVHGISAINPRHSYLLDSVVSTRYDPSFAVLTGQTVLPTVVGDRNQYIGGIGGTRSAYFSGVANSIIGGEGANYVGGLVGYQGSDSVSYSYVLNSEVYGQDYIGGAVGQQNTVHSLYNTINATVKGRNYIGGISGNIALRNDLPSPAYQTRNIFVGRVEGNDFVGGLAGSIQEAIPAANYSYSLVVANIKAAAGNASFTANVPVGSRDFMHTKVYENSTISINGGPEILARDRISASAPAAGIQRVTTVQMKTPTFYTSNLAMVYHHINTTGLTHGFFPYRSLYAIADGMIPTPPMSRPMDYVMGKDASGNYLPVTGTISQYGGIPIPSGPVPFSNFMMASGPQEIPTAKVYPSGGGSINIEFSHANPNVYFAIHGEEGEILLQPIEERTYTVNYDYKTPISLVISDGFAEQTYELEVKSLRNSILTWNDEYYYISDMGIEASDSGLLVGDFINIRGGEALTSSGALYSLATGSPITQKVEISLAEQTRPLYTFNHDESEITTYQTYSKVGLGASGTDVPLQLMVKDDTLTALDPNLPIVWNGLLVGTSDSEIMTVLGNDGKLGDMKTPITLPESFKNEAIAELSNNLETSSPHALVRYRDGKVVAFNYITGELLPLADHFSGPSLLEYAKDFFNATEEPILNLTNGFIELQSLSNKLVVSGLHEVVDGTVTSETVAPNNGDATQGDAEKLGTMGEATGAETEAVGGENLEASMTDKNGSEVDGTGNTGEQNNLEGDARGQGDTVASGTTTGGDASSTTGEGSTQPDGETSTAGGGDGLGGGDLALPSKPVEMNYVTVYNARTGQYELYDEQALLGADSKTEKLEPLAVVNEKLQASVTGGVNVNMFKDDKMPNPILGKGVVLIGVTAIVIIVLLVYILDKKRTYKD